MSESLVVTFPSEIQYVVPAELVQYFAHTGGEPEKSLIEWGRRFLTPDGVFVDIGAHIGTYALSYASEVRETHAFEAQRDTFYRLCGGIALRGNDTVYAHNIALSDTNFEQRDLRVLTSDGGLSSICDLPTNQHPFRIEKVMLATLDSYGLDDVCLVKIDVEGHELAVLKGAAETLERSKWPPLLVEVWTEEWFAEQREALSQYLTEIGYLIQPAPEFPYMWVCQHRTRKAESEPLVLENIPEDSESKKRLLLTMIVKNESRVIERALRTMLPHVAGYVICDTGSTDGTPAIIGRLGKEFNVRGTVHRTEWKNYGHNRTESATRAREWIAERGWDPKETYLLFCDADMRLRVTAEFAPSELVEDSYQLLQGVPGNLYPNTRLARADYEWMSHGVTHEFWGAAGATVNAHLHPSMWLEDGNDGGNRGTKFERDRALLEAGLALEPTNERYMFYLAQTYFDLGEYQKAIEWYEKRWQAGGWGEERMYARMKQGRALLALGDTRGVDILLRAFSEFPHRNDPLFHLAVHYREQAQNHAAELLIERARRVPQPNPAGALFLEQDIYEWRLDWEQAIVGYYTGNKVAAAQAADRVARFRRPGIDYEHLARNIMHYTAPLTLLRQGTFQPSLGLRTDPSTGTVYESSSPTLVALGAGTYAVGIRLVNYHHANGKWFNSKDPDHVIRTRELLGIWMPKDDDSVGNAGEFAEVAQNVPADWPAAPVLGLEDQRFVRHQDRVWFTANSWQTPDNPSYPQMVLGRLNKDLTAVEHLVPLKWSGAQAIEKNWLPFEDWGELRLVYGYEPLVVLRVDEATGACTEVARHPVPWHSGRFRGSAGPVRAPGEKPGWLLLVHEVTVDGDQRIYGQRLLELDAEYKPTRLSAPFYIDHRGVEFPLGFVALDAERAIITYGREERESAYAIVAWSELLGRLSP
jgi:FkbM family methyltransferase